MKLINKLKNRIKMNDKINISAVYNSRIKPALEVFQRIMGDQSQESVMMLCPYAGTGDVYLACMYIKEYARVNGYSDYTVVVIGGANYRVASLFEFDRTVKISQHEADCLVRLSMFLGDDNHRIIILHHRPPQMYCGILENMRNINELNFTDLFLQNVFHLDLYKDRQIPKFDFESPEIDKLFAKNNLVENRTVILSPYVNTLPSLPWWVWANLAEKLKELGYVVCTNCGTPNEFPIKGTIPLSFSFDISVPVLERCGYFIGIRSGFCDIISSAACKKIIVYQPYLFWGAGTNYDYFSLNKIGFCDDAIELEYHGVEFYDLIDEIINNIQNG